ncbi:hypothetical protein DPEC_G00013720 [Dallia pectoralis]|uniref:Uncharacterized protein n=1 Tax=Dallia pectoralis TaxID=75939 RepID=A0ACC2HM38_DALPE|nr:hypothetical protein DPEC_G00013720 [Dallia pectoralis]
MRSARHRGGIVQRHIKGRLVKGSFAVLPQDQSEAYRCSAVASLGPVTPTDLPGPLRSYIASGSRVSVICVLRAPVRSWVNSA